MEEQAAGVNGKKKKIESIQVAKYLAISINLSLIMMLAREKKSKGDKVVVNLQLQGNGTNESDYLSNNSGDKGKVSGDAFDHHEEGVNDFYSHLISMRESQKEALKKAEAMYYEVFQDKILSQGGPEEQELQQAYRDSLQFANTYKWINEESANDYKIAVEEVLSHRYKLPTEESMEKLNSINHPHYEDCKSNNLNEVHGFFQGYVESVNDDPESEDETGFYYQGSIYSDMCSTVSDFDKPPPNVIDEMWNDFDVDKYVPRKTSQPAKKYSKYKPKITIPKPFKVAEKSKNMKTLSRSALLLERERTIREYEEELECDKTFRAREIPASTLIPRYDQLVKDAAEKKERRVKERKEKLKEMCKPFSFEQREKKKLEDIDESEASFEEVHAKSFRANPIPKNILYSDKLEQIAMEDEYRKVRIKLRAEEQLKKSSLPKRMQLDKYCDGKERSEMLKKKEKKAFISKEHKFTPAINREVPDFEALQAKFEKQLAKRKRNQKPLTVVDPYFLRTTYIPSRKDRVYEDMVKDETFLPETRWPFLDSRTKRMSNPPNYQPPNVSTKETRASELRALAVRRSMEESAQEERVKIEQEIERRKREKTLKRRISSKVQLIDPSKGTYEKRQQRLRKFKSNDFARREQYQKLIDRIYDKVENRPLLFEQISQFNARRAAERKFEQALEEAGVDLENFNFEDYDNYSDSDAIIDEEDLLERSSV